MFSIPPTIDVRSAALCVVRACAIRGWFTASLLTVFAMLAFPGLASALTISGTAVHDEQAGGAWALCDGSTQNVALVVDGGTKASTSCSRSTGAFSFTTTLASANRTIVVFMDPATTSAPAVAYTHNVDTTSNITGLELIHDRVIVRSEGATVVTGAQMNLYDKTQDADIPIDVAADVTVDAGVGVRVDAGDTWQPGAFVWVEHLHLRGTLDSQGFELDGSGRGACGFGPGASRPLCISPGGALVGSGDARFYMAHDSDIEAISYPGTVIIGSSTGATAHVGTATGQTLTAPSNMYVGWWGNDDVIVDTTRMAPNITVGQRLFFLRQAMLRGYGGGTVSVGGSLFGSGRIDMPATDLVMRAKQSYAAFGSSWFGEDGGVVFRDVRFENDYTRYTWGGGPLWNGMTAAYNSGGAQADTPSAVDEWWGTLTVAGTQATNGGDWQLAKYDDNGSPSAAFGASGKVTWNSGGAQVDAALGIDVDDAGTYVVGYQGTNGRDWAIRRYDRTTGVADATFGGGAGTVTYNSGLGSSLDEARTIRVVDNHLWVGGVVGTTANGLDWMVRKYTLAGVFESAATVSITAGDDQLTWMMWDNNNLWVGGSAAVNGGDWAIRKIDVWGGGVWGSLPGGTSDTIIYGPTAGADASTAGAYINTEIFSDSLIVGGTQATNGGDWVLRAYHADGYAIGAGTLATWNSGGVNNDRLAAIKMHHESITAIGDNGSDWVMRRYDGDGAVDQTWGTSGQLTWDSGTGVDAARAVTSEYWGDMFVVGTQASNGGDLVVRRYNFAGQLADTNGPGNVRVVGMSGLDDIHLTGDVSVGAATDAATTTLDLTVNDHPWDMDGDLTITSKGVVRASNSASWRLAGSLTTTGPLHANGGTLTLDDARRTSTLSGGANLGLANLRIERADKQVQVGTTTQLDVTGQLTVDGGSCASPVRLASTVAGTRARINATGASTLTNVRFQDIQAVAPLSATNAVDGGNNLGVTFATTCTPALAAPTDMFAGDTSAATGTRHRKISATHPRFSWLAPSGTTFTSQRMQVLSTPPSDAVGLWHLDGAGTDAGTGAAAVLSLGTSPQDPAYVGGQTRFGQALDFDGDDRASIPAATKLDLAGLTVDLWMESSQLPAASSGTAVLARRDGTFALKVENDGTIVAQARVSGIWEEARWEGAQLFDGTWHHIAMVAGPTSARVTLYVDGVRVDEGAYHDGAIDRPTAVTWIGDDGTGTAYYRGRLDEIRVSGRELDASDVRGMYRARQPHATVLWDSSPGGTGTAMASCTGPARCADITYGGTATDLLIDGARYYARAMYRDSGGTTWTPWSDTDWFETAVAMSIGLPGGVVSSLGTAAAGSDNVGQADLQVTSNAAHGYSILASTTTDAWGMSSGVDTVPRFNNPIADTPAAWAPGAPLGFGVTVLSAPGRSSARWGTGTVATDVGTLNYAGVSRSNPVTLATTATGTGVAETTRIGLRANAPVTTRPGAYSVTIALTAVANP